MKTRNVWILAALLCGQIGVQAQEALPKEVKVGKERIKARHEICLPQIDDYQLLKCDFHIHTIFLLFRIIVQKSDPNYISQLKAPSNPNHSPRSPRYTSP